MAPLSRRLSQRLGGGAAVDTKRRSLLQAAAALAFLNKLPRTANALALGFAVAPEAHSGPLFL